MADAGNNKDETRVSYHLLEGTFTVESTDAITELTQEDKDQLERIFNDISTGSPVEKDEGYQDFEKSSKQVRFLTTTAEDLDKLEAAEYDKSTHWQTSWAVRCLKGNCIQFSVK